MSLWRPRSNSAHVGLDSTHVASWPRGAGMRDPVTAGHDQLGELLQAVPAGTEVQVIAGNDLALHWLQIPPISIASLDELQRVAQARCSQLYGGVIQDWWIAGAWDARRPFVCCALPRSAVDRVQRQFASSGVRARWHTAWSIVGRQLAALFPSDGWSALGSARRVLLWSCRRGQVQSLSSVHVDDSADSNRAVERVQQQMRLDTCRIGNPAQGAIHWLDLTGRAGLAAAGVQPVPSPAFLRPASSDALAALALGQLLGKPAT